MLDVILTVSGVLGLMLAAGAFLRWRQAARSQVWVLLCPVTRDLALVHFEQAKVRDCSMSPRPGCNQACRACAARRPDLRASPFYS